MSSLILNPKSDLLAPWKLKKSLWKLPVDSILVVAGEIAQDWMDRFANADNYDVRKKNAQYRIRKNEPDFAERGSLSEWTFGMVTGGGNADWLLSNIEAIRKMKLVGRQIIITGNVAALSHLAEIPEVELVQVNDEGRVAWITRKKNVIFEHAQFENICVLHDRIALEVDFAQLEEQANYFEIATGRGSFYPLGRLLPSAREMDWMSYGLSYFDDSEGFQIRNQASLAFDDWSPFAFANGTFFCVKREIARRVPLNEALDWNQMEDIEWSHRALSQGFITTGISGFKFRSRICKHPWVNHFDSNSHGVGTFHRSKKDMMIYLIAMLAGPLLKFVQLPRMQKTARQYFDELDLILIGETTHSNHWLGYLSYLLGDGLAFWLYLFKTQRRLSRKLLTKNLNLPFFTMPEEKLVEGLFQSLHFRPPQAKEKANALELMANQFAVGRLIIFRSCFCAETLTKHFACRLFK